jgi:hypothetical protein
LSLPTAAASSYRTRSVNDKAVATDFKAKTATSILQKTSAWKSQSLIHSSLDGERCQIHRSLNEIRAFYSEEVVCESQVDRNEHLMAAALGLETMMKN